MIGSYVLRFLISLAVGIAITVIGFKFGADIFHAPVWLASRPFAYLWPHASNATQNLSFLAINILSWTFLAYLGLQVLGHKRESKHGD